MKKIEIAVLSYNLIRPYGKGIEIINGEKVLVLSETFNPKSPENVLETDKNWSVLIKHKDELKKVIIFAGKKESGALEIISLAARSFEDKKDILFFVLCDHDLEEKKELLKKSGFLEMQYISFSDSNERCYETPFLLGFMLDFIKNG